MKSKDNYSNDNNAIVSILIPTLNEENNVADILIEINKLSFNKEIIVIDGGSKDKTVEICRKFTNLVFIQKGKGKGCAIRQGVARCNGEYIIIVDADGSHRPEEIPLIINHLFRGADIVKGSRFKDHGKTFDMEPWRNMGNRVFVILSNLLFHGNFSDLCYGYLGFKKQIFEELNTKENGFAIDAEITIKALKRSLEIVEVPSIELLRNSGKSRLRALPDGLRIFYVILFEYFNGDK